MRQVLYVAGKALTYSFIGGLAGLFGHWVVRSSAFGHYQALFAYVLGGALVLLGLGMVGVLPLARVRLALPRAWNPLSEICAAFVQSPGRVTSLLLGAASGFLPCPITASLAAAAATTHSVALGVAAMAGLGVGTSVVLLLIGLSGSAIDTRVRRIGLRGAGLIVLLIGMITLLRPGPVLHRLLPHGGLASHGQGHR
jgi:hypothetical protein